MGKIIMSGIVNPLVAPSNLPPIGTALNDMTWEQVRAISDAGIASNYFSIGDTKEVTLNGTVGSSLTFSNTKAYMQILAFDHNKDIEMNGESHILFGFGKSALTGGKDIAFVDGNYGSTITSSQYLHINTSSSNSGGWASSTMRTSICPAFKNTLPSDLQSVLQSRTIYTNNVGGNSNASANVTATTDEVYIPAEFEVTGSESYANSAEQTYQKQLAYYASGNSKIRYRHSDTSSTSTWWLRSSVYNRTNTFCSVTTTGTVTSNSVANSLGFVPLITI